MYFAFLDITDSVSLFMERGGPVLNIIAMLLLVKWSLVFERIWYLSHAHSEYVSKLADTWNSRSDKKSWHALQIREKMMSQAKIEINRK